MNQITPVSVADAGQKLASSMGLQWPSDRTEVLKHLNLYRSMLYNRYPKFSLFDSVTACVPLYCEKNPCNDCAPCDSSAWVITLPPSFAAVTAAWKGGKPLRRHSRWEEVHSGIADTRTGEDMTVYPIDGTFATSRPMVGADTLQVFCEDRNDAGSMVYVSGVDAQGRSLTVSFMLAFDSWVKSEVEFAEVTNVQLTGERRGAVKLSQGGGYELSVYAPSETVPSYRRAKIILGGDLSCCECGYVLIRGTKSYADVSFDTDIVEIGDPLILELAGTYFRYWKSKDRDEKALSNSALADIYITLDGAVQRNRGTQHQDFVMRTPINNRHNLYRR